MQQSSSALEKFIVQLNLVFLIVTLKQKQCLYGRNYGNFVL